jgi:hypothetical protein
MRVKTVLKIAAPLAAACCLAFAGPTFAAPTNSASKQSQTKPDCKKSPSDPRCKGK